MAQHIPHWIDGARREGASGRTGDVTDSATGEVIGEVPLATTEEVDAAVPAATAAFPGWRDPSLAKRTAVLFRFRELLNARKPELAAIITAEHGKVLDDALGEVSRGQEVVEFACGIPHLLKGGFTENASSGVDVHSVRQPLGPVAVISPFNFPAMVPMWFFPVAIATGNTVVLKPSGKDPTAALWIAELWKEAGLPDGVFNVVQGDKVAVDRLLEHPDIQSVSFVGSTAIAQYVYETGTRHGKRVQALGGAKNHMVVLPDADLDLAADAAVNSGFGPGGERCMAINAVVAVGGVGDDLVARIAERTNTLRTGDGRQGCDMGPLISKRHRDRVESYVEAGEKEGAKLVVELINRNEYGNGTAIFTNDGGAARRFQHEVEVGMIGINVPIPVPMAYYSFGGWKNSLFGDTHAHGAEGVHFFTRGKVITSRWLDPSHGGLNLGFPQNA